MTFFFLEMDVMDNFYLVIFLEGDSDVGWGLGIDVVFHCPHSMIL